MTTAPELVIFDCDGVLIDSEVIAARVNAALLGEVAGMPVTVEEVLARFVGISDHAMFHMLEAEHDRALPDGFAALMAARNRHAFEKELVAIAGAAAVSAALPYKKCVASSSTPERLRHSLGLTGLKKLFEPHIFSTTMVARGKPAPDLFLYAAERMAAAPSACVVIEDSVAGVEAARAAGMTAFGFRGGSHCLTGHGDQLTGAGASLVFDDMLALPQLLRG